MAPAAGGGGRTPGPAVRGGLRRGRGHRRIASHGRPLLLRTAPTLSLPLPSPVLGGSLAAHALSVRRNVQQPVTTSSAPPVHEVCQRTSIARCGHLRSWIARRSKWGVGRAEFGALHRLGAAASTACGRGDIARLSSDLVLGSPSVLRMRGVGNEASGGYGITLTQQCPRGIPTGLTKVVNQSTDSMRGTRRRAKQVCRFAAAGFSSVRGQLLGTLM